MYEPLYLAHLTPFSLPWIFLFFEGGRERGKRSRQAFPYLCPRGSRTARLLWTYIAFLVVYCFSFMIAMFAQLRRAVREQADT